MSALLNYLDTTNNPIQTIYDELGVRVKEYAEGLYVFNYSQIDSPKTNDVVRECRGSICARDDGGWFFVCRPFKRFFNYGEASETLDDFDFSRSTVFEKADGSLIKFWYDFKNRKWHVGTRGTAYAETENEYGVMFRDLIVDEVFNGEVPFNDWCNSKLPIDNTHMFELTSPKNRIVTKYNKTELVYLGSIDNYSGDIHDWFYRFWVNPNVRKAKQFNVSTIDRCIEAAKELPNLEEGFVVRDNYSGQMVKIKSPLYVAAHHLRGDIGLTPKKICKLVVTNETDEYLKYFPDDQEIIQPYIDEWEFIKRVVTSHHEVLRLIQDQKEFALIAQRFLFSYVLFMARKNNQDPVLVLNSQRESVKIKLLQKFMEDRE